MNKEIISNLLNNNLLSLSLSETDQNIFRTYLNAIKLNNSLIVLYLQNIDINNVQALLNILTHNKSLQQLYFSGCDYNILSTILYYFKLNYYINIHLSICATFKLSDNINISDLLLYNTNINIVNLFCIISDEDCLLINNNFNLSNMEIIDNSINLISNYKLLMILFYIKPLINSLIMNKLLFLHLNFMMFTYNIELIPILKKTIKQKFNLSDDIMKRIDIMDKIKFHKSFDTIIKK